MNVLVEIRVPGSLFVGVRSITRVRGIITPPFRTLLGLETFYVVLPSHRYLMNIIVQFEF